MTPRLHHLALGARDVERVAAFYRDVLGLPEHTRHILGDLSLRSVWLRLGEALLMVERTDTPGRRVEGVAAGPFLIALAIAPEAHRAAEERLSSHGVCVESRSRFTLYFRDPEGNRVALSSWPDEASP